MPSRRRLSQHFTIEEFDCHDGTRVPTYGERAYLPVVTWWLEPLREEFGQVTILSGFRTRRYNHQVGGAEHSVHLLTTALGRREPGTSTLAAAADVRCELGDVAAWNRWAVAHRLKSGHLGGRGRGGVGYYPRLGFVHLDTASMRDWQA